MIIKNLNNVPLNKGTVNDYSISTDKINVHFRNLEEWLCNYIAEADGVFGCVAWFTNNKIIDALKGKQTSIIVQKEDFLRPDGNNRGLDRNSNLRRQYKALKCTLTRYDFHNDMGELSIASDPTVEAVRCVGNYNTAKTMDKPRMHNKFLVFTKIKEDSERQDRFVIVPYAVWTGSFNMTFNATNSLENAVYIKDLSVANAYFHEFGHIFGLSEQLNWEVPWCEPQYRIGT